METTRTSKTAQRQEKESHHSRQEPFALSVWHRQDEGDFIPLFCAQLWFPFFVFRPQT